MSEVFSFRLNKDNPREVRALKVLKRWQSKGYNTRHIVIEALLKMEDADSNELKPLMLAELNEKLNRVSQLFENMEYGKISDLTACNLSSPVKKVSDSFINSIKEGAKPGISLE